jgi:hypothetical protein
MKKKYINPYWENGDKQRIICSIEFTRDDGTIDIMPAAVSPDSPDWEELVNANKEIMDQIWDEHVARRDEQRKKQDEGDKRNQERIAQEDLFTQKLEIFEIDKVKNSKNRQLKSMIRKAKNQTEALIYASILVKEEMDKELIESEQPTE